MNAPSYPHQKHHFFRKIQRTVTALTVVFAVALSLAACDSNTSYHTDADGNSPEKTESSAPLSGKVIPCDGAVYYTDCQKIYRIENGKSKAVIDVDELSCAQFESNMAVKNGRIFFEADFGGDGVIYSIKPDGSDITKHSYQDEGYIVGNLSAYSDYSKWSHDGYIYYIQYKESKRTIILYKALPDESGIVKLGTFKTVKNNDGGNPVVAQALYPVIDGSEYIYFSYGFLSGTGLFFGDSRIARAKLDGSEYEVVDSSQDNDLGTLFSVNNDGSVKFTDVNLTYDELMIKYYCTDNKIYGIDPSNGTGKLIITSDEYKKFTKGFPKYSDLSVESVDLFGSKAYIHMESTSEGETRYDSVINGGFFLEKDLDSGKVSRIYKYGRPDTGE